MRRKFAYDGRPLTVRGTATPALKIRNTSLFRQRPLPDLPIPPFRYSSSEDVRRFRRTAFCPTNCCPGIHASIHRAYSSIRSHFSVLPSLPVGGCADTLIPPDVLTNRISKFESDCPVRDSRASHEICPRFRRVDKGHALLATVSFFFRFLHRPSALSTSA